VPVQHELLDEAGRKRSGARDGCDDLHSTLRLCRERKGKREKGGRSGTMALHMVERWGVERGAGRQQGGRRSTDSGPATTRERAAAWITSRRIEGEDNTDRWGPTTVQGGGVEFVLKLQFKPIQIKFNSIQTLVDPKRTFL
jgi:hypothetical protein